MSRIALVTEVSTGVTNGVTTSVAQSAASLRALGHEVHVYAPWHPDAPVSEPGVYRVSSWGLPRTKEYRLTNPWGCLQLIGRLAAGRYDVVHSHHLPSVLCLVACLTAILCGSRRVVTYHTYLEGYAHYVPLLHAEQATRLMAWLTTVLPRLYQMVIAPSHALKRELQMTYHVRRPIEVLPTGIEPERYRTRARREFIASLGIDPDRPVVMYVGRVAVEKNLPVLLRAFARIVRSVSDVQLVIVGGGPALDQLKTEAQQLGITERTVFTGMIDRELVAGLYGWATLFVSPSKTETQGITYAEAGAAGVARVAIGALGALDAIEHDVDGWLVAPGSEQQEENGLYQAIQALLLDAGRRARYGQAALRSSQRFTIDTAGRQLAQLYQILLQKKVGA